MKKKTVSVLKPRINEKSRNKVKGITKNEKNLMKKSIEKNVVNPKARGKTENVLNPENVSVTNNLKESTNVKMKLKKVNVNETKVKNGKGKKGNAEMATKKKKMAVRVNKREGFEDEPASSHVKKLKKVEKVPKPNSGSKKKIKKATPITGVTTPTTKSEVSQKKKKKRMTELSGNTREELSENSPKLQDNDKKICMESVGNLRLSKQHILSSIKAIKKLEKKEETLKKSLLSTEDDPILLQVTAVRVPKTPHRKIRPYLPHPLVSPSDDVALFVPDLETGRNKDYEKTVEYWEAKFEEKGVKCIKQIIPMNQVKTEFSQYEMKRKLASTFDHFLADGRICNHLTHLLSKAFFKRHKPPTPVKLSRDNLKQEINFALHKTCMQINSHGNTHTVQVGKVSMRGTNLVDNIWETCKTLEQQYPGGWMNIRTLHIKTQKGKAIPIYMNLLSKNTVSLPVVKPKRPRAYETVEGELTTVSGNATVTVTPEGTVKLKKMKKESEVVKKEESEEKDDNDT